MSEHTAGPWEVDYYDDIVVDINGDFVASTIVYYVDRRRTPEENRANSELIAAAPELLEALRDAEFIIRKLSINPKEIGGMMDTLKRSAKDAKTAIAKAEKTT